MRQMLIAFGLFAAIVVSGCGGCAGEKKEEEDLKKAEPPPVLTCDQLYNDFKSILNPLFSAKGTEADIHEGTRGATVTAFTNQRSAKLAEQNFACAMDRLALELDDLIRDANQREQWNLCKAGIRCYKAMRPADTKHDALETKVNLILGRPEVTVTGFFEANNYLYVFLSVRDKTTGEVKTYKVREGEEFHDLLRLERIIGNQEEVEIWYEPMKSTWIVPGPKQ